MKTDSYLRELSNTVETPKPTIHDFLGDGIFYQAFPKKKTDLYYT